MTDAGADAIPDPDDLLADNVLYHPDGSCLPEWAAEELATHLGLQVQVVYAMPIGWQDDASSGGYWLFPETDGVGHRVGSTCRFRDGRTTVLPGGRRGLSEPDGWDFEDLPLLLPVGVSDTLALTAMDLPALGRPGDCEGLDDLAQRLLPIPPVRSLILFPKEAGQGGTPSGSIAAQRAAAELSARLDRSVAWAVPPDGALGLRAWVVSRRARDAGQTAWADLGRQFLKLLRPQAAPGAAARGITAVELLQRDLPKPTWVVDGLLPEGVTILAGKPKSGKSWLALHLAVTVACGGPVLGSTAATPGDVLYLALEDTERRLKSRLQQLLTPTAGLAPARLNLVTTWRRLEEGGRDDLAAWLGAHAGARLVVVDTLAMLRSRRREAAYQDDYRAIAGFRRLAARSGLAVLIVHHVRKQTARDPFDAVSGTLGLTGAADTVWVLNRSRREGEAVLHVTGRDVDDQELALAWNGTAGLWSLLGPAQEHRLSKEQTQVLDVLIKAGRPLPPRDVAPLLDKTLGATKVLLWRMAEKGLLVSENGAYAVVGRGGNGPG